MWFGRREDISKSYIRSAREVIECCPPARQCAAKDFIKLFCTSLLDKCYAFHRPEVIGEPPIMMPLMGLNFTVILHREISVADISMSGDELDEKLMQITVHKESEASSEAQCMRLRHGSVLFFPKLTSENANLEAMLMQLVQEDGSHAYFNNNAFSGVIFKRQLVSKNNVEKRYRVLYGPNVAPLAPVDAVVSDAYAPTATWLV